MATYRVTPAQLGASLRRVGKDVRVAIGRGMVRAAQRGKLRLVQATKAKGKIDQGQFLNSFQVRRSGGDVVLENNSPMAGVIELGARPHAVSQAGLEALEAWAARKLGLDPAEAKEAAEGIARKLARHGQAPSYVFRDELLNFRADLKEEVSRAIRELAGRGASGATGSSRRSKDPKRVAAGQLGWARRRARGAG